MHQRTLGILQTASKSFPSQLLDCFQKVTMLEQINEWNSFLFREGMKAERDDPRPKAPADIFNLFRVYNIPQHGNRAFLFQNKFKHCNALVLS